MRDQRILRSEVVIFGTEDGLHRRVRVKGNNQRVMHKEQGRMLYSAEFE